MSSTTPSHLRSTRLFGTYDYPLSHRLLELGSLATFVVFAVALGARVAGSMSHRWSWVSAPALVVSALAAYAVSDLLSGLVHFLFDNFGTPSTAVIGQKFVKPFRDHHTDPMAMTHGDFIAVNADNFFACLPVLVPCYFLLNVERHPYVGTFLLAVMAGTIVTNQIHKWAHLPEVPRFVRAAQRHGIVLSAEHHARHHTAPFDTHYCITWGRLDPVLDRVARRIVRQRATPAS